MRAPVPSGAGALTYPEEIPIKILWHSVSPWTGTGYGVQTGLFTPRIKALGHDVAISAFYGLQGAEMTWKGMKVYANYHAAHGTDVLVPHALHHFGAHETRSLREVASRGVIITLYDVWPLNVPMLGNMAVAAWTPVDHETLPPIVGKWFQETGAVPIAMSRFGERKLVEAGLTTLYVPHGVDTSVFFPADQAEARERVGLPADAFVVAIVAANVGQDGARKAFYEQILAFKELRAKHADTILCLHTDVDSPVGVHIRDLLADLPERSYIYTDPYAYRRGLPAAKVADIYRAADVLSNATWGEGFGIPIMEAQACGRPVVVTDTTAMPELVGAGWLVEGEPLWHNSQRAWAKRPLIASIVDAYAQAYDHARNPDVQALAWAKAQEYDADVITERYWKPVLAQLEAGLEGVREQLRQPPDASKLPLQVREADGLLWLDRGHQSGDWVGYSDHEAPLQPILEGLLPEGGVFLDVGAHVGRWTLRLAKRASRVVAVEPNPVTAATLRRHLALNDIGNVTVLEVAAWDEAGQVRLQLEDPLGQVAGGSTRTLPLNGQADSDQTVQAVRLDDYLLGPFEQPPKRIDLVKLDVEGADLHALRGMKGLLERYRPALFIEDHSIYGYYQREDLEALLVELGYMWRMSPKYMNSEYYICRPAKVDATRE